MDLSIIVDGDRVIKETKTIALERNSNAFPKMRNTESTVFSRPVREWYVRADQYILVRFIELTLTRVAGSIPIQITAEIFVKPGINSSRLNRALSPTSFENVEPMSDKRGPRIHQRGSQTSFLYFAPIRIILATGASLELSALQRVEDTTIPVLLCTIWVQMRRTRSTKRQVGKIISTVTPISPVKKQGRLISTRNRSGGKLIEVVVEEKGKRDKKKANTFRVALALFIFVCEGPPLPLITLLGTTNKKFTKYHLWLFDGSAYLKVRKTRRCIPISHDIRLFLPLLLIAKVSNNSKTMRKIVYE
ncbi:hypothetical protein V1478_016027 [Vespula squamosa]|uniref:Uncharacterized protein n=1 Tax=Vespula squamosa TaxID=30214 RepID=A0ABD2A2I9_VESSQ